MYTQYDRVSVHECRGQCEGVDDGMILFLLQTE